MHLATTGPVLAGTAHEIHDRNQVAHAAGGQALNSEQFQGVMNRMKTGEASGTDLMSLQPSTDKKTDKTVVPKTAAIGRLIPGHSTTDQMEAIELARTFGMTQIPSLPQSKALQPHVDVSNKTPPRVMQTKKASRCALGERYPLDSYAQVKMAAAYFTENQAQFTPAERHEYCMNLVSRADELAIEMPSDISKYGSASYAPADQIKVAMDIRRHELSDPNALALLDELQEKQAMLPADLFCAVLEEFDKTAGLQYAYDKTVPDPFYSTYGVKAAEDYSYIDGNDHVTEQELKWFGKTRHKQLVTTFGDEFAEEFRKDPVGIFKSLPKDQKKMVLHMATDNSPGADNVP
jgi:hypothetical protein